MDELKKLLEELQKAFAEFKKANDERLVQLEKKGHSDPLVTEKVEKLNAKIGELETKRQELESRIEAAETKAGRPTGMGGDNGENRAVSDHKKAFFGSFVRKGIDTGLTDLEMKALNITTPADGGFAVPTELDREILALARDENIMRQICNVVTVGTSEYKKLMDLLGTASGWVGEQEARPATGTPTLAQLTPYMGEIYAFPQATQQMLDDVFFNVEAWLASALAEAFAAAEETAFVSGNGTKKPKGFLAYPTSTDVDGTRAFGTIQYATTGNASGFRATNTSTHVHGGDDLVDMIGALKAKHRAGAAFLAAKLTYAALRKVKDANEHYIWEPSMQAGQPSLLLGYPAKEQEAMPAMANGALIMAFGNFKKAYYIVDRMGSRMLRDPFTNKPFVGFYTTKRVGGMLVDSEAVKLLKQSA